MAKKIINVGASPNDRTGDSLRSAFTKINDNFTELYNGGVGGGTVDLSGVTQDIIPSINNRYNLGSPTHQWHSLYVSNHTIYINNIPLSIDTQGNLLIDSQIYRGEQGPTGATGPQGIPGNNGADGAVGPAGPRGLQGDKGDKGDTGLQGPQGVQGPQGATGPKGDTGTTGATGQKGDKGDQGLPGNDSTVPGPKGDTGAQGVSVTLQGTKATIADLPAQPVDWNTFAGHGWIVTTGGNGHLDGSLWFWNLTTGEWNDIGPIVGPQGDKGDPGVQGAKGDQGLPGNNGVDGAPGAAGANGADGADGARGSVWFQGSADPLGNIEGLQDLDLYLKTTDGSVWQYSAGTTTWYNIGNITGPQGDQGPAGADGAPGATGPKGDKGDQGDQGPAGPSGTNGVDGVPGTDGLNGASAFEIAVAQGFTGTEAEWLASLVGPQGPAGTPGSSLTGWTVDAFNNLNPNTDNLQDIGTPSLRVRHIYVGPGSITVGNSVITESNTGKLVLPGLTRGTGYSINEVEDTDDQTYSFNGVPTIIDNAHFAILNGANRPGGYVPPEYSVDQLDGDGYIDGISIDNQGSGLTQDQVNLMRQNMWAYVGSDTDPIGNWNSNDWISIPFRVRCEAGDVEYEFNSGGGSSSLEGLDDVQLDGPAEGQVLTWNNNQEKWENRNVPTSGGGSVVFRSINFPKGEEGDTQGTFARTEDGKIYLCYETWADATPAQTNFETETSEDFLPSQTGGVSNVVTILAANNPEILSIIQNGGFGPGSWIVEVDNSEFGGQHVCTDAGLNVSGNPYFMWPYRSGTDPVGIENGTGVLLTFVGTNLQPDIWEEVSSSSTHVEYYDAESDYTSTVDLSYDFVVDLDRSHANFNGAGDWDIGSHFHHTKIFSTAELDQYPKDIVIMAGSQNNNWMFGRDGVLTLPDGGDITREGVSVLGKTVLSPNLSLDGGGAAVVYERNVAYVDGGFSSSRQSVTYDGGSRSTETNTITLDGGGA